MQILKNFKANELVATHSAGDTRKLLLVLILKDLTGIGILRGIPVFVDESLAADQEILFNAGTNRGAIRMSCAGFERLVKPKVWWWGSLKFVVWWCHG